jgi:hypothetical protein
LYDDTHPDFKKVKEYELKKGVEQRVRWMRRTMKMGTVMRRSKSGGLQRLSTVKNQMMQLTRTMRVRLRSSILPPEPKYERRVAQRTKTARMH